MPQHNDRVWRVIAVFDHEGRGPVLGSFPSRAAALAFGFAHVHRDGFTIGTAICKRKGSAGGSRFGKCLILFTPPHPGGLCHARLP